MKRISPLKILALLSILIGLVISILTGGYLIILGGYFVVFALVLFLVDWLTKKIERKLIYRTAQYLFSISYLTFLTLSYLDWNKHLLIVIPEDLQGESGIVFGIDGYPELPEMKYWKQKIVLPESGVLVTSTLKEDIPSKFQFEFADGDQSLGNSIEFPNRTTYRCVLTNSELKFFSFTIGEESNSNFQSTLSSLCDSINLGKLTSQYESEYSPIVESVEQPYLQLQNENLSELPSNINTLEVKKAILTGNRFTEFPTEVLNMPQLEELLLGHNPITELPDDLTKLGNLKSLSINKTLIKKFPADLSPLSNLETIGLDHNDYENVPESILTLPKLKNLRLNDNLLTDLKFIDERLAGLEELHVYSNSITQIDCQVGFAINLEELLIFDNEIDSIPDCISQLQSLKNLQIWGNPITYVSPELGRLTNLRTLRMEQENLTEKQMEEIRSWLPNCKINFQ